MRVTGGGFKRRFVYGLRVGKARAVKAMYAGQQVWPGNEERVRRIALDMSELAGSLNYHYWLHAMDAVRNGSKANKYMGFAIAERQYRMVTTYMGYPLATYDYGILDFGDDGPLYQDVRVGDTLTVEAVIAARNSSRYTETQEEVCPVPYIQGTNLQVVWHKGRKKGRAGCNFIVKGQPGGVVHFGGSCYTDAHRRGRYTRGVPGNPHKWSNAVYDNSWVQGEERLLVSAMPRSSFSGAPSVMLLWPAFRKSFKFKVTGVWKKTES